MTWACVHTTVWYERYRRMLLMIVAYRLCFSGRMTEAEQNCVSSTVGSGLLIAYKSATFAIRTLVFKPAVFSTSFQHALGTSRSLSCRFSRPRCSCNPEVSIIWPDHNVSSCLAFAFDANGATNGVAAARAAVSAMGLEARPSLRPKCSPMAGVVRLRQLTRKGSVIPCSVRLLDV